MVWKTKEAKREWQKAYYERGSTCACGVAYKRHLVCAACGILVGPGHEGTMAEPFGKHKVCYRCYQQLNGDFGGGKKRITHPLDARHGEMLWEDVWADYSTATNHRARRTGRHRMTSWTA